MKMKKIITLSVIASTLTFAGGYKIPEQSLNGMALGAAYVAHTTDADTAYYNPANMSFLEDEVSYMEGGLTLAHLPSNQYDGIQLLPAVTPATGKSETENLPIPYFHYVAPAIGKWRYGVSMVAPGGLTKRWKTPVQKLFAEEFTLKVIELNPSVSYKVNDNFSVAGGIRMVYSEGIVKSDGNAVGLAAKRDMKGNSIDFGYNLAMTYKPTPDINLAVTYRSNVDLTESGEANLYLGGVGQQYNTDVTIPLPATLSLAISKTWNNTLTLEFVYERTYWSAYKALDFQYDRPIQAALVSAFDDPKDKSWEDTNTFRLGVTYAVNDTLTLMGGYAYDKTPVPKRTLSYELADSDANIFSAGFRYQQTKSLSWGAAVLYDSKDKRTLNAGENGNGIIGTFSDGGALLMTVGASYRF